MPKDRNSNEPSEEVVAFDVQGERVVGTLRLATGKPQPVILLFPGFGGVRDELQIPSQGKGIFAYIAGSFASLGFSSLRIDFRGSGESDGLFENTTYSSQIADGIAAMAIGLAALQTVLEEGNKEDWFGSDFIVRLSVIAAVSLTLFLIIELKTANPLLNLRLLVRRNFGFGIVANFLLGIALYGSVFVLPIYLTRIQGYNSEQIGMSPGSVQRFRDNDGA